MSAQKLIQFFLAVAALSAGLAFGQVTGEGIYPKPQAISHDAAASGGGIFQIKRITSNDAEVAFYGLNREIPQKTSITLQITKNIMNSDIQLAVVRRMIEVIRFYESSDFKWESRRLGGMQTLSARPSDSASLVEFLLSEFFPEYKILNNNTVDSIPPIRKYQNHLAYPPIARREGVEGLVKLRVQISANGLPEEVVVAQTSGSSVLDEAALRAVQNWLFVPASVGGKPIAQNIDIPVRFQIKK